MPALVTTPPTLIDPAQFAVPYGSGTNGQYGRQFLFPLDSQGIVAYVVLLSDVELITPVRLRIFKTTNRGANWTLMDDAHSPTYDIASMTATMSGGLIYLAYGDNNVSPIVPIINTFNTATDLYGVENTSSTDEFMTGRNNIMQIVVNAGTLWLFTNFRMLTYAKFNIGGGTWSAYTNFVGSGALWFEVVFDASNNLFNFFTGTLTFGPTRVHIGHQTMDLLENFIDLGYIFTSAGVPSPQIIDGGPAIIWNGNTFAVPFTPRDDRLVRVALGAPLNAPVWTITEVDPTGSTIPAGASPVLFPATVQHNTDLVSFWNAGSGTSDSQGKIWMGTWDGVSAWSAPVLFYDQGTNPPPDPPLPGETKTPQMINVAPCWLLVTAMGQFFGYSMETEAGCVTAPVLACPITNTGTLGIPFTATLQASGGTPPYTFALLSGPDWLSVDPATGVLSGTPTSTGTFDYTAQVTDANDNVVTVDCSIEISSPEPPPPPELCIIVPTPATSPTAVAYNEPLELQGS